MSYSTSAAATNLALLDALRVFLLAEGWTVNRYADIGASKTLSVEKDDMFFNFFAAQANVVYHVSTAPDAEAASNGFGFWCNPSTGFDNALQWYKQPGAPLLWNGQYRYAGINSLTGSISAYHFFTFADCVYIVLEQPAGRFAWLGFGTLTKRGDWSGGQFLFAKHQNATSADAIIYSFFGSAWAGTTPGRAFLRVEDVDGFTGWATAETFAPGGNFVGMKIGDTLQKMATISQVPPNLFNSLSARLPVGVIMTRDGANFGATTPFSLMGYLDGFYYVNIKTMQPGALYPISTDNYRVFSIHEKRDEPAFTFPTNSAGNLGFCLKTN